MILKGNGLSKEKCRKKHFSPREMRFFPRKRSFCERDGPGKVLRPQAKTSLMPKRLYMDNSSFRDILARFLEEKSENSPLNSTGQTFRPEPTPLLQWDSPNLKQTPKNGYPPPKARKTAPPQREKPSAPREIIYLLADLQSLDQDAVATLLHIGAVELNGAISLVRLKKAHRRLVKALHPDRILANLSAREKDKRREQFLMLQAAYETLSRGLKNMETSGKVSGNGSASESGSPHQDAA
jgi:hypothetical protein